MATYHNRFKLTPMPTTNRWRKIHRGKIYYLGIGHCTSKHDREGYKVAWAEWKALLDVQENTPTPDEVRLYELAQQQAKVRSEIDHTISALDDTTLNELRTQSEPIRKSIDRFRQDELVNAFPPRLRASRNTIP